MPCCAVFCLRPRRHGKPATPRCPNSRKGSSSSGSDSNALVRAGSTASSVSDTDADATEQRVQGSTVAVEDLEICRHADGKPWLLGAGGHAATLVVGVFKESSLNTPTCGMPMVEGR